MKTRIKKGNARAFLRDAEQLLKESDAKNLGENSVFSKDVQMLDGFKVGFMEPTLFARLAEKHGFDASTSEAILMQTTAPTEPHVHLKGNSTFLPLGAKQGYRQSAGGTYMGVYKKSLKKFTLRHVPARAGKLFRIAAGKIHFFAPEKGATFSAIAFVAPRIKQHDGTFDMRHFTKPVVSARGRYATVEMA